MGRFLHAMKHVAGKSGAGNSFSVLPCTELLLAWLAREAGGVAAWPGAVTAGSLAELSPLAHGD